MEQIEILKGIFAVGKALWLTKQKIMIIADLHIGYEEALNKSGILVPRMQFKQTKQELLELLGELKPKTVIINGDLKHEFGEISKQEWQEVDKILDLLLSQSEVILVKGNHDTILEPIARKKGLEIKDYYCFDDICVTHGNKIRLEKDANDAEILIIANEHPAISLHDGVKSELYKCFLLGKWKRKELVVLPSFLSIVEGSDIKQEEKLSPYLQQDLSNFEVFVIGDRIYKFGRVKDI